MGEKVLEGGLSSGQSSSLVVGIDPSLTGFAMTLLDNDTGLFISYLYKPDKRGVLRLVNIQEWMKSTFQKWESKGFTIEAVGIEDGVVASYSAFVLGELAGAVKVFLYDYFLGETQFPVKIPPTMVKKYATNRGNAKKNEVLLGIYKQWGIEFTDDNMADSFVIAKMTAGEQSTVFQKETLMKLSDPKFRDDEF